LVSAVIKLTKLLVPVPSSVWLSAILGLGDVFQHTPLLEIGPPPLSMISPPLLAVTKVMLETIVVIREGMVRTLFETD